MKPLPRWSARPYVVQNLFNPAFCGLLLWEAIRGYNDTGMEYPLSHVVLPMVLHRDIRYALPSTARTTLIAWLQGHPEHAVLLPSLISRMVPFTSEGLLWATNANVIRVSSLDGKLSILQKPPAADEIVDDQIAEVSHCVHKAGFVGKWLAKSGSAAVIYAILGVRP